MLLTCKCACLRMEACSSRLGQLLATADIVGVQWVARCYVCHATALHQCTILTVAKHSSASVRQALAHIDCVPFSLYQWCVLSGLSGGRHAFPSTTAVLCLHITS
jgi:hypothetical protein